MQTLTSLSYSADFYLIHEAWKILGSDVFTSLIAHLASFRSYDEHRHWYRIRVSTSFRHVTRRLIGSVEIFHDMRPE